MQVFLTYLFLFITGCFIGWCIEVLFRRYITAKRWVNPGFMKGPWLPLYGFGVITMYTMCYFIVSFFPESIHFYNPLGGLFEHNYISGPTWADLIPIVTMGLSMILLEFIAGLIFIKGFKVKLWDYTNMKGNILGIICPVFSIIWMFVAVIFYYAVNPFLYVFMGAVRELMFGGNGYVANFGLIFALGTIYGVFIYDFVSSVGLFNSVSRFARESGAVQKFENVKDVIGSKIAEGKHTLFLKLPKIIQETYENRKNNESHEIKDIIAEKIYIDPEKEKDKANQNYDEYGRPVKIEDEKKA